MPHSAPTPPIPPLAVQRFAALVREATGNVVPAERYPLLEELIARRARATGQGDAEAYLQALADGRLAGEWSALVPLLTIKESYFFRAPQQLAALRRRVLPALLDARAGSPGSSHRRLRIWSAACARGEEPATLALLLAEDRAFDNWDWTILATDLDEEALEGARRGLYGERAVAQVPPDLLARWFSRRGKLYELSPNLRAHIDYRSLNLAQPPYDLPESAYDLVLLRNLLIYFRRPLQARVVDQVALHLAPDGYLLLGASETLWQLGGDLEAVDLGTCFAYCRGRGGAGQGAVSPAGPGAAGARAEKPDPLPPTAPPTLPSAALAPAARSGGGAALTPDALPHTAPRPARAERQELSPVAERLLQAARQLAGNQVREAAEDVADLLESDPTEPAAHALSGLLHDLAGRTEEAVACYRAVLYLDPHLYQARVLLAEGLLRLGRRDLAENQFREVLATLATSRARPLAQLGDLPLPSIEGAGRRSREVLGRG
jgi:chemotaxis protein methyltransferase CheR